jgi:hypothetical protein
MATLSNFSASHLRSIYGMASSFCHFCMGLSLASYLVSVDYWGQMFSVVAGVTAMLIDGYCSDRRARATALVYLREHRASRR